MVSFRLQSILASMAKYYWILHYLSLLLSRLKHSFICKGVIGKNADIHFNIITYIFDTRKRDRFWR